MKFGVRECCDVVLRAKAAQKIGNKIFYKNEPVCYFDTLKTSTLEGAATTVYAQGGRGNARLMSWDGERTVTFTMEDALISPVGLAILTGAGLIEATEGKPVIQHVTEYVVNDKFSFDGTIKLTNVPYKDPTKENDLNIYVMGLDSHGEVVTEPYLFKSAVGTTTEKKHLVKVNFSEEYLSTLNETGLAKIGLVRTSVTENEVQKNVYTIQSTIDGKPVAFYTPSETVDGDYDLLTGGSSTVNFNKEYYKAVVTTELTHEIVFAGDDAAPYYVEGKGVIYSKKRYENGHKALAECEKFLVDYYRAVYGGAFQVDITPDKFGGSFYLEASTLWRDQGTGQDLPAEFIIPNCRVQSNFTFTMASSGDPSSFTFTMDAFPDYTRYDADDKVLARIQVIGATEQGIADIYRTETWSLDETNKVFGKEDSKPGQDDDNNQTSFNVIGG